MQIIRSLKHNMQLINVDDNGAIGNMTFITWCWCFYCSLILAQIIIFVFCHTLALAIILCNEFSVFLSTTNHLFLIFGNTIIIFPAKQIRINIILSIRYFHFASNCEHPFSQEDRWEQSGWV